MESWHFAKNTHVDGKPRLWPDSWEKRRLSTTTVRICNVTEAAARHNWSAPAKAFVFPVVVPKLELLQRGGLVAIVRYSVSPLKFIAPSSRPCVSNTRWTRGKTTAEQPTTRGHENMKMVYEKNNRKTPVQPKQRRACFFLYVKIQVKTKTDLK